MAGFPPYTPGRGGGTVPQHSFGNPFSRGIGAPRNGFGNPFNRGMGSSRPRGFSSPLTRMLHGHMGVGRPHLSRPPHEHGGHPFDSRGQQGQQGPSAMGAAKSLVDLQVMPELIALRNQRARMTAEGRAMSTRAQQMYQGLEPFVQQAVQNASSAQQSLAQQFAQISNQAQSQIGAAQGAVEKDPRGAAYDAGQGQRLSEEFAHERLAAAQSSQNRSQDGLLASSGAKDVAIGAASALPLRALDAQKLLSTQEQSRLAPIDDRIAGINATRGDLLVKALGDVRDQRRTARNDRFARRDSNRQFAETVHQHAVENTLAAGALNLNQRQFSHTRHVDNAGIRTGRIQNQREYDLAVRTLAGKIKTARMSQQEANQRAQTAVGIAQINAAARDRATNASSGKAVLDARTRLRVARIQARARANDSQARVNLHGQDINRYGFTNAAWGKLTAAQRVKIQVAYEHTLSAARRKGG